MLRALICHTGKEAARSGSTDQYTARGGSALSDGARMVAVLRSWDPEVTDDKLSPPPGLSFGIGEQAIVLARPKLSYAPPQPIIWITRRGYAFQHFIATRADPQAEAWARADQLERYLIAELARGSRYSRNTLKDTGIIKPREKLFAALSELEATGRVIYAPNPGTAHTRGGAREYLHPVAFASPMAGCEANEKTAENDPLLRSRDQPFAWSAAYREKNGEEANSPYYSPSPPRSAGEAPRSNGEASEANEMGDIQGPDEEPQP